MAQTEREVFRWLAIILGLYALWCAGIMFAWYQGWLR
jgi:hypothetical protein